ncbi:hypothetical protein KQI63_12705 [bacterium]|nr:hypothetical protein [bacterium]
MLTRFYCQNSAWITILSGIVTSLVASVIIIYFPKILAFIINIKIFRFLNIKDNNNNIILVADLLILDIDPSKHVFKKKDDNQAHINGSRDLIGDCTARSIQYLSSWLSGTLKSDPTLLMDNSEKATWDNNLILIGSKSSNVKTEIYEGEMYKKYLYFGQNESGTFIQWNSDNKKYYISDNKDKGVIIKTRNPFYKDKFVILCAGLGCYGTSGAAYYLYKHWKHLYSKYKGDEFAVVLETHIGADETAKIIVST